jgi:hypothetical protein
MLERKLERLARAGIQTIPAELDTHYILERDGFLALVERREDDFGGAGAAGLLTERGLAPLVWREDRGFFVVRGFEREATPEDVTRLRAFQRDLEDALRD